MQLSDLPLLGNLRRRLLTISFDETSFARRKFYAGNVKICKHLESVGRAFVSGYQESLQEYGPDVLAERLNRIEPDRRGFAFEGAALGLTVLDQLSPWGRRRLRDFLIGSGAMHIYMVHVGVGWAIGQMPWLRSGLTRFLQKFDPLLRWLAIDGYGFYSGYFHWPHYISHQKVPKQLDKRGRQVFDQGLGRSLWFVEGADVHRIAQRIAAFDSDRRADLWSGVGLACAYAGGIDPIEVKALRAAACSYRPQLAQGAAFAAKTRQRAENPAGHTELACRILCGLSAVDAAGITDEALEHLPIDRADTYAIWRDRIQKRFTAETFG
jgi:hypothetical protein